MCSTFIDYEHTVTTYEAERSNNHRNDGNTNFFKNDVHNNAPLVIEVKDNVHILVSILFLY